MSAASPEVIQLLADAERWATYAHRMNQKALDAGLVTADELAPARQAAQEALSRPVVGSPNTSAGSGTQAPIQPILENDMSKQPELDLNPFYAMSAGQVDDWHHAIADLAQDAWAAVDNDQWSFVNQGLEDARRAGKISEVLERAFHDLFWKATRVSAVYGYALGRTQPSGLEEFADWPRRAFELAGLAVPEASGNDDPPAAA